MASSRAILKPSARSQSRSWPRANRGASRELDRNLEQVLASLSQLLVASGYGFHRAMRITKLAFVEAARNLEGNTKRVSIARVAATTGLTRIEVSRLLKVSSRRQVDTVKPQNRAAQVALGWMSDKRYNKSPRSGRLLAFEGKRASFKSLVKAYSGDIPARAMLTEMKRLGMVRQEKNGFIRLIRTEGLIPKNAISAMRAISPWVNKLTQFSSARRDNELTSSTNNIRLCFASIPQVLAAIRLLDERRTAFLDSIPELGGHPARNSKFSIEVTIAIAAAKPSKIAMRQHHPKNKG